MTQREAIIKVLEGYGHPVHYKEITKKIEEKSLCEFYTDTPEQSILKEIRRQLQDTPQDWSNRGKDYFYQDVYGHYGLLKRKDSKLPEDKVVDDEYFKLPEEIDNNTCEGAKKQITVNRYERSAEARKNCISYWGTKCSVCDFDFEKAYGNIGKNYIHIHHIKPLSEITQEYKVDYKNDLIPICPNCHAMIHSPRTDPPLTIEKLKEIYNKYR